jgi:hypothetical protein
MVFASARCTGFEWVGIRQNRDGFGNRSCSDIKEKVKNAETGAEKTY